MQSLSHSPQSSSTWRSENFPLFPAFLGILHLIKGLTWEHILGRCSVERLSKHPISLGIIKCFIMLPWKPVIIQFQTGMSCFENTWHQPHKGEGALDWNLWRLMPNVPVQSCRYAVCISVVEASLNSQRSRALITHDCTTWAHGGNPDTWSFNTPTRANVPSSFLSRRPIQILLSVQVLKAAGCNWSSVCVPHEYDLKFFL